jgi:hypothetical protein
MSYTRGRHRSGRPGLIWRPRPARTAGPPRHLRKRNNRLIAPGALGLTLTLSVALLMISGYAAAAGAVAIASMFAP